MVTTKHNGDKTMEISRRLECQNSRSGRRCHNTANFALRYHIRGTEKIGQKMVCPDCRYWMARRGNRIIAEHAIMHPGVVYEKD